MSWEFEGGKWAKNGSEMGYNSDGMVGGARVDSRKKGLL